VASGAEASDDSGWAALAAFAFGLDASVTTAPWVNPQQ
jgi:hypothetical protein